MARHHGVVTVLLLASSGCATERPPAATAAQVERLQCDGRHTAEGELRLLRDMQVLDVAPLYSFSHSSYMHGEERIVGAKLLIRPPADMAPETLTRILQCHNARLLLGEADVASIQHDPYSLPNAWLNVDVTPEDGNYAVTMTAESFQDNLRVLNRAKSYAEQHMLASGREGP